MIESQTTAVHTLYVPLNDNDGIPANYRDRVRLRLVELAKVSGWTEHEAQGYWDGQSEPVVTFTIYDNAVPAVGRAGQFAALLRAAMPDQQTVLVGTVANGHTFTTTA